MKVRKKILFCICLLCCLLPQTLLAGSRTWALNGNGSITISYELLGDAAFEGETEISIYQVERLVKQGDTEYLEWTDAFEMCNTSLENLTASEAEEAAVKLVEYIADHGISGTTRKMDIQDKMVFTDLEFGTYLVVIDKLPDTCRAARSFLVSVPMFENNSWVYDIQAQIKVEKIPELPEEPGTSADPETPQIPIEPEQPEQPEVVQPAEEKLPQTGQVRWPIYLLTGIGMVCLIVGALFRKKKRKFSICAGTVLIIGALAVLICQEMESINAAREALAILNMYEECSLENLKNPSGEKEKYTEEGVACIEVEEALYIGEVIIPSIEITLPVCEGLSYPQLKKTPCRYRGSVDGNSLIIAAHNYNRHFGNIGSLAIGDEVIFTGVDGTDYVYQVTKVEILEATDVAKMQSGDWDLTLFTCTYGGQRRVTVRCSRVA